MGLAIGALRPAVSIPDVIKLLGLAIFVYSIGLSSGPAYFSSFKKRGATNIILAVTVLSLLSVLLGAVSIFLGFDASGAAGMLACITTNTPALAGLLDAIQSSPGVDKDAMPNSAVIGYSISYFMGVLGLMISVALMRRLLRIDFVAETKALSEEFPSGQPIVNQSVVFKNMDLAGLSLRELKKRENLHVVFGRLRRDGEDSLCHWDLALQPW